VLVIACDNGFRVRLVVAMNGISSLWPDHDRTIRRPARACAWQQYGRHAMDREGAVAVAVLLEHAIREGRLGPGSCGRKTSGTHDVIDPEPPSGCGAGSIRARSPVAGSSNEVIRNQAIPMGWNRNTTLEEEVIIWPKPKPWW
jgi:hypothetical protein